VDAPAGSVVFTHCGILHAGSRNKLPSTRVFVSCYINRVGLPVRDVQQGQVRSYACCCSIRARRSALLCLQNHRPPPPAAAAISRTTGSRTRAP
jgi:hypothetical protein